MYGLVALMAVAAALFVLGVYLNRDQESNFYAVNVEPVDLAYLDRLQLDLQSSDSFRENLGFGFSAHRLKVGRGMVLAHRHFSGGTSAVDDETYQKLSVWLRTPVVLAEPQTLRIPDQGVVLLSSGGSAWPRNDCSGYITGVVDLTPRGSDINVRVEGTFEPRGNRDIWHTCNSRAFTLQFQAARAQIEQLTPWQGGAGATHPYHETYVR